MDNKNNMEKKYGEWISCADALPEAGDRVDIGTGYQCDRGIVVEVDSEKRVVWESDLGGIYKTPIGDERYNIRFKKPNK